MLRLLLLGVIGAATAQQTNPRATPEDVTAGGKTFRSHCAPCHGLEGSGGRGPALNTGRFHHATTDADLLRVISNGIQGTEMPGQFYEEDKLWQVVAYLRSLGGRPSAVGNQARGAALYIKLGCAQCHRIAGQGGRLGPDLSEIGRSRAPSHLRQALLDPNGDVRQRYWLVSFVDSAGRKQEGFLMNEDTYTVQFIDLNERLHSVEKHRVSSYKVEKVSKMPSYKDQLGENQINDLVAFLASQRPEGSSQ